MSSVRPAQRPDLRATARLHRLQLPDGFFAQLGPGFLRTYHRSFLDSPHGVAIVVGPPGEPVGFLVGTLSNREHYRHVLQRDGIRLAGRGLAGLLVRPPLLWTFLRTRAVRYARWILRYPLQRAHRGAAAPQATANAGTVAGGQGPGRGNRTIAVLTHVAVAPQATGGGTGRALVTAFLEVARRAGADEARLVTTAHGPAEPFYDRLGWTAGEIRAGAFGNRVREYRWSLHETSPS